MELLQRTVSLVSVGCLFELISDDLSSTVFSEAVQQNANLFFQKVFIFGLFCLLINFFLDLRLPESTIGSGFSLENESTIDITKSTRQGSFLASVLNLLSVHFRLGVAFVSSQELV